jgi:hypothetical protein
LTHSAWRYSFACSIGLLLVARAYAWDHGLVAWSLSASIACLAMFALGSWRERETIGQVGILLRRGLKF